MLDKKDPVHLNRHSLSPGIHRPIFPIPHPASCILSSASALNGRATYAGQKQSSYAFIETKVRCESKREIVLHKNGILVDGLYTFMARRSSRVPAGGRGEGGADGTSLRI